VRSRLHAPLLALALLAPAMAARAAEPLAAVLRSGPDGCHAVALTFDLCPVLQRPGWDRSLVDFLESHHVPATFFASGRWIATHDPEVQQLLSVPFFELGTHGQRHRHLPALAVADQRIEIMGPVDLLASQYRYRPTLFRAPYGEFDDHTRAIVADAGLRLVEWSVVSGDPDPHLTAATMLATLRAGIRDGSIVIFHANGKGAHTREVVETLVRDVLPERRLTPRTVSQVVDGCHDVRR
jgi:peptidoglycan/xylan/chitin deacetylase (PgdA/CDA1 family)